MEVAGQARKTPRIVVVGSVNIDATMIVARTPSRGETVLASERRLGIGGKGANQAVACTRLGHPTAFVGCVGGDPDGEWASTQLRGENVGTEWVRVIADAPTGAAVILSEQGESTIVVDAGANAHLSPAQVRECRAVAEADAVLCQLEVPVAAVQAAAESSRGAFVLNPAPAQPLPLELLGCVDVLIPNQHELAVLIGAEATDELDAIAEQAASIEGPQAVVVTLGANGALVVDHSGPRHIPAWPAERVDATAAGDSFCAGVVDGLLHGLPLAEAVSWANCVASITITRPGAVDSLPTAAELARARPAASGDSMPPIDVLSQHSPTDGGAEHV